MKVIIDFESNGKEKSKAFATMKEAVEWMKKATNCELIYIEERSV